MTNQLQQQPKAAGPVSSLSKIRHGSLRWIVRRDIASRKIDDLLADPDRFLRDRTLVLADSLLITLGKVLPLAPGDTTLVVRRLNYGRWRHRWRDVFRTTRAERAFRHGLQLERAGVSTPRNIAVGVDRLLCWPRRAYLITEWVADAISLEDRLKTQGSLSRTELYQLADLLARLHENGFSHRDLKSSNVLFDSGMRPCLIDLDGVRAFSAINQARTVRDLTRFAWEFVKYPRLLKWNGRRFLKRYCRQRSLKMSIPELEKWIAWPIEHRLKTGIRYWKK